MKYLDYAAFGAASSAYAEASRARTEVALLWGENQRLRDDIDSQRHDREFQKWAEDLIYQFSKVVKAIETSPAKPLNDFMELASSFHLIEAKELDTCLISGFEQKEKFDETVLKAQNLLSKLETNKEVQKYIRKQEAACLEQERQQDAVRREDERLRAEKAAKSARAASRGKLIVWSILGLSVLLFIKSIDGDSASVSVASIVGMALAI